MRPLDEVGVEDVGNLWRHDGAVELLLELPDLPDDRAVVEHGVQRAAEVGVLGEDLHDRGVGKVEPRIFNHRASEITAEVIEEELIVLHILIKFGPANIGTMQAQTAKWREK